MHVRDRLRAALAQKRALEFCWSCAIVRSHQVRWLQTSAASAGLRPERLPTESDPPLAFDFRETKVNSFKIKEIPLHPILESTPRQSRVYREGHHDTTETQKNSNGVESVAERRERLRFIIPGLRTFKNESVEVRKVRGGRTFKNESVEARKVRGGIFRKTWIKSPRAWTAGKSEVLRGDIMDLLATSMGIPARRKSRPSSRTGAATRTSHGIDRLHANSISSAADVAATELDADTKLEGPMLDHLVDPLTPDPSEGMTAQRAAISSRPINNLVSFHPLWTPSGPMSSSNTSRLRYEDGFQASPILGTRSNSTVRIESAPDTYSVSSSDIEVASELPSVRDVGIREHLRLWQERQSEPRAEAPSSTLSPFRQSHSTENSLTQSIENDPVDTFNEALSSEEDDDEIDPSETDVESQSNHQTYLEPGDVAYIVSNGESIPAIFIRYLNDQVQLYSMTGQWVQRASVLGLTHIIPRMFSPQELGPILPYLPMEKVDNSSLGQLQAICQDVPRDVAGGLLEKLQRFQRACAEVHRQHLERLGRIHSLVAYEANTREMMLHEIASIVLQKPDPEELTDVMLWTIHAVLSTDMRFKPQNSRMHHLVPLWRVSSRQEMHNFEHVRRWVREYQEGVVSQATALNDDSFPIDWQENLKDINPIPRFIHKTKRLIQDSRTHRSVVTSSQIGPSRHKVASNSSKHDAIVQEVTLTTFTTLERQVIGYLKSWCLTAEIPSYGSTFSLAPILLRAIGTYDGHELDIRTALLFLMEIGACAPWDDRNYYDTNMHLPTYYDHHTKHLFDSAARSVAAIGQGSETLQDSLASLRKDWGNMAVYAIDGAEAREIDDGISLEKIEGDESAFWVHVHIANPSAFIKPGDAVQRYAAQMISTIYKPEKVYPMIDPRLSQAHFSLANDRAVLTVSIKLTVDGEIIEKNITPGRVHNVQRFTPSQVSQALGNSTYSPQGPSHVLTVGQPREDIVNDPVPTSLSTTAISDLRKLQQLGHARRTKRSGGLDSAIKHMNGSVVVPEPHVYIQRDGLGPTYSPTFGRRFIGDPAISWAVKELNWGDHLGSATTSLVSDIMILACEVVGNWCSERNIPALYRGTERKTSSSMQIEIYKAKYHAAVSEEHKYLFLKAWIDSEGTATQKSMPVPHDLLGIPAYTQITSPLRRYTDMLVHWQLQAALLYEARHGQGSLIGSRDDSYLPFSRTRLDSLVPNMTVRDRDIRRLKLRSKNHWIHQLLSRAFYFGEAELPTTVDVLVCKDSLNLRRLDVSAFGIMKELNGYGTHLLHSDVSHREGGFKVGDWWQCRIKDVDTFGLRTRCEPIRLLKRDVLL